MSMGKPSQRLRDEWTDLNSELAPPDRQQEALDDDAQGLSAFFA